MGDGAGAGMAGGCFVLVVELALIVLIVAGMWKVFEKAGKPGWAAIIPIYNIYILLEIVGKPIWWLVMFFIPCVSIVFAILLALEVAKAFGKDALYGIGLALLPFIFYPLLGFGDAKFQGPTSAAPKV